MSRTLIGLVGTVSATQYSATLTGSGTDWNSSLEGKYIRLGNNGRMYTINRVDSVTSLQLTERYQGPSLSGQQFMIGDGEAFQRINIVPVTPPAVENNRDNIGVFDNFDNS